MDEQDIVERWGASKSGFSQVEVWDEAAAGYAEQPIPSFEDDPFLQFMDSEVGFLAGNAAQMTVLDIGCGAGGYSIALAPYVKRVVGCDLSSKMIEAACARAKTEQVENVSFICDDFATCTFDDAFCGSADESFDIVFAHFTPALSSGAAFQKMMGLTRAWCYVAMPTRRTDFVLQELRHRLGIPARSEKRDENCLYTFALAWLSGKTPRVEHYDDVWIDSRTLANAKDVYANHLVATDLTPEQKTRVSDYLASIAQDDVVYERIETTVVMMGWHR